jgi:GWxTD domain-containing protein
MSTNRPAFRLWSVFSLILLGSLCAVASPAAQSPTIGELFRRGKSEFKMGSYRTSLTTFDALEEQLALPDGASAREKLAPLVAFYRGANLAALGEKEAALTHFEIYLAAFPSAHLDPAIFPRRVIETFETARGRSRPSPEKSGAIHRASGESAIAADYSSFRLEPTAPRGGGERWAEGALRFLMTPEEHDRWNRLHDESERAEFIATFWKRRDPTPQTLDNEFRDEIERRVRFSDARFTQGEKKGSETDRGMVFVLMGPPSYIGQKPLKSEDDPLQAARAAPIREVSINPDGTTTTRFVSRPALTAETIQGAREVWHYRRDRLPAEVKFTELDFEFISRKGFGTAVLQRDPDVLAALDRVARATLLHLQ